MEGSNTQSFSVFCSFGPVTYNTVLRQDLDNRNLPRDKTPTEEHGVKGRLGYLERARLGSETPDHFKGRHKSVEN